MLSDINERWVFFLQKYEMLKHRFELLVEFRKRENRLQVINTKFNNIFVVAMVRCIYNDLYMSILDEKSNSSLYRILKELNGDTRCEVFKGNTAKKIRIKRNNSTAHDNQVEEDNIITYSELGTYLSVVNNHVVEFAKRHMLNNSSGQTCSIMDALDWIPAPPTSSKPLVENSKLIP